MEEKRTLWIVAAIGIFLLAVLGAALILYSPVRSPDTLTYSLEPGSNTWINPNKSIQNIDVQNNNLLNEKETTALKHPTDSETITSLQLSDTNNGTAPSDLSSDSQRTKDLTVYSTNTTVVTKDGVTMLDLSAKNKTAENTTTPPISTVREKPVQTTIIKKDISSTTNKKTPSKTAHSSKKTTATKKTTTSKTTSSRLSDAYWVQAASYTNKANAEKARDALLAEKIPGEVFTFKGADGVMYYRLRVGAYTTKSEADYWNTRIRLIDDFAKTQSYVTNSSLPAQK
ncbi:MAG TPA: SPOR domain-containing protein [Treponemataceae bacterium]|nr:SPOR domain-containing protein [Treponemataceae bacterium]